MITKDNLENVLDSLGFVQDEPGQWERRYPEVDCSVIVDTRAEKIRYPEDKGFKVNERETCNFSQNENFVVMECVCRLLEKGYRPESIELERRWPMGHEPTGGRADVCIDDISGVPSHHRVQNTGRRVQKSMARHPSRRCAALFLLAAGFLHPMARSIRLRLERGADSGHALHPLQR